MPQQYFVTLCVVFKEPFPVLNPVDVKAISGYYQNFGVTAYTAKQAQEFAARSLDSDDLPLRNIDWNDSEVYEKELSQWRTEEAARCQDSEMVGVWFRSARIGFP